MKYLMLICWDAERMDATPEPDPSDPPEEDSFPWLDDVQARGIWVAGDRLAPPRRARTVRVRNGERIVTDGPFAETKEILGGFALIEVADLDAALVWAKRCPLSRSGTVEVRPQHPDSR